MTHRLSLCLTRCQALQGLCLTTVSGAVFSLCHTFFSACLSRFVVVLYRILLYALYNSRYCRLFKGGVVSFTVRRQPDKFLERHLPACLEETGDLTLRKDAALP